MTVYNMYNPEHGSYYTDTQDIVSNYLQAPAGVLLTTTRLYNSMEANSVIVANSTGSSTNRCAVHV